MGVVAVMVSDVIEKLTGMLDNQFLKDVTDNDCHNPH